MGVNNFQNDGGPAFPQLDMVAGERDGHGDIIEAYLCAAGGMTLRDWVMGQCIAAAFASNDALDIKDGESADEALRRFWGGVAYAASVAADAMITARGAQ